jgi:hypothetical protein
MLLTTRVGAQNPRITEEPADDLTMEIIPNEGIMYALDASRLEDYSRKQGREQTTLCMKVYLVGLGVLTVFVMRSMIL